MTFTPITGFAAVTVSTMKSRSTSVFCSILWVIWNVNSEKPTLRSYVPAASQSAL